MIFPILLSLLLSGSVPDDICLIRINPTHPKQKLWIYVHQPELGDEVIYGGLTASDLKFEKLLGAKPVRHVFPANWDGLGMDELIVVRERVKKQDHRLELRVYRMPDRINGNTGSVVAKSRQADLGVAVGDGRIVCVGPVDLEGDDQDEVALVREAADGRQFLEVRRFPRWKNDPMGSAVRSDSTFGQAGTDENLAIFGSDVLGDAADEIVVLRRGGGGPDRLLVFQLPAQPGGETGPAVRSDLDLTPADGGENLGMWRMRPEIGGEYQALVLRRGLDGRQRLELFGLPSGVGADVGASLQTHLEMDYAGTEIPTFAAFGARDLDDQPWVEFHGSWKLLLRIAYQDIGGNIIEKWVGPYTGFAGTVLPWPGLTLTFPPVTTIGDDHVEGAVSGWESGNQLLLGSAVGYLPTIHFYPTIVSDIVVPGDRITITYPAGVITNPDGQLPSISGQNAGGLTIGEVIGADNVTLKAVVYEYRFWR
ncbi:MAG: hypothetical protein V2A76_06715 [Planctomycetota bacterium]